MKYSVSPILLSDHFVVGQTNLIDWLSGHLCVFNEYLNSPTSLIVEDNQIQLAAGNLVARNNLGEIFLVHSSFSTKESFEDLTIALHNSNASYAIWIVSNAQEPMISEVVWLSEAYQVKIFLFLFCTLNNNAILVPIISPYQIQSVIEPDLKPLLTDKKKYKKLGAASIPLLEAILNNPKFGLQQQAAVALSSLGNIAIPTLIKALYHTSEQIRLMAAKSLINVGEESLPFLMKELEKDPKALKDYINDFGWDHSFSDGRPGRRFNEEENNDSTNVIMTTISKILDINPEISFEDYLKQFVRLDYDHLFVCKIAAVTGRFGEETLPYLVDLYLNKNNEINSRSFGSALIRIGESAIPELLKHLHKVDNNTRKNIIEILEVIDPFHYKKYTESNNSNEIITYWKQIRRGREGDRGVLTQLLDLVREPNGNHEIIQKIALVIAVQYISPAPRLILGLYDSDRNVRMCSVVALGIIGNNLPVNNFLICLKGSDFDEKKSVLTALQNADDLSIIPKILPFIFSWKQQLRYISIKTVGYILFRGFFFNKIIPRIMRGISEKEDLQRDISMEIDGHRLSQQNKKYKKEEIIDDLSSNDHTKRYEALFYLLSLKNSNQYIRVVVNLLLTKKDLNFQRFLIRFLLLKSYHLKSIFRSISSDDSKEQIRGVFLLEIVTKYVLEFENKFTRDFDGNIYKDYALQIEKFLLKYSQKKKQTQEVLLRLISVMSLMRGPRITRAISNYSDNKNDEVRKLVIKYISSRFDPSILYLAIPFLRDMNTEVKLYALSVLQEFFELLFEYYPENSNKYAPDLQEFLVDRHKLLSDLIYLTRDENDIVKHQARIIISKFSRFIFEETICPF